MEKENFNKENRYANLGLYEELGKLKNCPPECMEIFLSSLQKVTYSLKEDKLLGILDILTGFVVNNEDLRDELKEKIVDKTVNDILPILNDKNPENIKELVAGEYGTVLENFEEIRKSSESETASQCSFANAVLTFPGSTIIDGE